MLLTNTTVLCILPLSLAHQYPREAQHPSIYEREASLSADAEGPYARSWDAALLRRRPARTISWYDKAESSRYTMDHPEVVAAVKAAIKYKEAEGKRAPGLSYSIR
jgi:hypothetical protein